MRRPLFVLLGAASVAVAYACSTFEAEDAPAAHEVYSDPEVMRYVATGPLSDPAMTRRLLYDYRTHQDARATRRARIHRVAA